MNLTLTTDVSMSERPAVSAVLSKLAADTTINYFEAHPDGVYWIDAADVSAYEAHECGLDEEIAESIATAIRRGLPHARFWISVIIDHCCTGCNHDCEREETIWTTSPRPTPEERAVSAAMLAGELP
jgi:hypothetical protein